MKSYTSFEVLRHFESISIDSKPLLVEEILNESRWILIEIEPDMVGDESNLELEPGREEAAVAYSKLSTDPPPVIARRLGDGSFEILDGRRRLRAAALKKVNVLAFLPKR